MSFHCKNNSVQYAIGTEAHVRTVIKTLVSVHSPQLRFVAPLLLSVGVALLIGGFVYRVFVRPDLSLFDALLLLWPIVLVGCVTLILGWLIDRVEG
jgi:VIT1/CCC1 family predicted Fe2+/Mn2+ transporter